MREIPLNHGLVALVDDEDYAMISAYKWYAHRCSYTHYAEHGFWINGKMSITKMHRMILQAEPGQIVDHANRDGLDNRRCNIRFATPSQNGMNKIAHRNTASGVKGVSRREGRWQAVIRVDGKLRRIGVFDTIEEAGEAYATAARMYFGAFARVS